MWILPAAMLAKWMLRCTEKIGENEHAFTFIGLFFTGSAILARCAGLFGQQEPKMVF